jgi:hypothetical protein
MYHHVKLMMYYIDGAGFAPAIRHSGEYEMAELAGEGKEEGSSPP